MSKWSREELTRLRKVLARLYPGRKAATTLAEDAGLSVLDIDFDGSAYDMWASIFQHAEPRDKIDPLLDEALADNPDNEDLKRAKQRALPPALDGPDIGDWRGAADQPSLEKIIGPRSTLVDVSYLEKGMLRARAVVRIKYPDGSSGTGFLVAGEILVTNNHVIATAEAAKLAVAQFNYQGTVEGLSAEVEELSLDPDSFFRTSKQDDWTAVRIKGTPSARWPALELIPATIAKGDHVNIIQHAGGGPKQIAFSANVVVFVGDGRVQYLTDTLPGSSGSPVFDMGWNVVALHHSGGWLTEPKASTKTTYFRNEGIAIDLVIAGLADPPEPDAGPDAPQVAPGAQQGER